MRKEFIERDEVEAIMKRMDCEEEDAVFTLAPWASFYADADGGFMAFESLSELETWENQN